MMSVALCKISVYFILPRIPVCSKILNWKWRKYKGANKHNKHMHVSFKKEADNDASFYNLSMLGGE